MSDIIEERKAFYGDKPIEVRLSQVEVREWEVTGLDGTIKQAVGLRGYASTFNDPYSVRDWLGEYNETIMPGAFDKALQERDDVRLLVNHEGIPIARTKSGTMTLAVDDRGLLVDVPDLDEDSPLVQSVRSAMKRGDMDQMSFSFKATRQEWNEDYTERFIREAKLYDVSVVTYPANPNADVKLRDGREAFKSERGPELPKPDTTPATVDPTQEARERRLAQLRAIARSLGATA